MNTNNRIQTVYSQFIKEFIPKFQIDGVKNYQRTTNNSDFRGAGWISHRCAQSDPVHPIKILNKKTTKKLKEHLSS